MNTLPNYDTWKTAAPDNDGPEPSDEHIDEAFSRLLDDDSLIQLFYDDRGPDFMRVFKLYSDAGGLPLRNNTFVDNRDMERMQSAMQSMLDDYRAWLDSLASQPLSVMAYKVMEEEIASNKADAEEYAADCARESRGW